MRAGGAMLALTSERRTWWHAVPAGRKLLALLAATVLAFWLASPAQALGFVVAVAGLYLTAGAGFLHEGLRLMRPVLVFVALIVLWHWWLGDLAAGWVVAGRMTGLIALANLLTLTTPLADLLDRVETALRLARVPARARARLALAVALVIRFTPVMIRQGRALSEAWRARSARRPGWRLVLPFTLAALDDAERVAEALRARSGGI